MSDMVGCGLSFGVRDAQHTKRVLRVDSPRHTSPPEPKGGPLQTLLQPDELLALNDRFEEAHPREILTWALERSGLERIAIASAFQAEGTIVMHMATQMRPDIPILFLETGYQFAETLAFKEQLAERLALNVVDLVGEFTVERQAEVMGPRLFERDPEKCCDLNKVQPMFEALRGLDAWITAFRRESSPTRATAPFVQQYELEPDRWIVKVNPMAAWSLRERVGVPRGARPPPQPALRPGVQLDRLRAVHADAVPRRAGARGSLGGAVEVGVRDPGDAGGGSAGSGRSGHDPEGLGRELNLQADDGRRASRRRPAPGTDPST